MRNHNELSVVNQKVIFQSIVDAVASAVNLPVSFWIPDEQSKTLYIQASVGLPKAYIAKARLNLNKPSVTGEAFNIGKVVEVLSIKNDKRWIYRVDAEEMGWQSVICVPVKVNNLVIGVMSIYSFVERGFTEIEKRLLSDYASKLELSIVSEHMRLAQDRLLKLGEQIQQNIYKQPTYVYNEIVKGFYEVTGADCVVLYPYDYQRENFYDIDKVSSFGGLKKKIVPSDRPRSEGGMASFVRRKGEIIISNVAVEDPEMAKSPFIKREAINAFYGIVLRVANRDLGIIYINFRKPHTFSNEECNIIRIFAYQASVAINNTILYNSVTERATALEHLISVAPKLVSIKHEKRSLRSLLQTIASNAKSVLKADLVGLYQYHQGQDKYELPPIQTGKRQSKSVRKAKIYDDDVVCDIVKFRNPKYFSHAQEETVLSKPFSRSDAPDKRFVVRENLLSVAAIPLTIDEEIVGVLFVNYRRRQTFPEQQKKLIELYAAQAAIAIKNARKYHKLQVLRQFGESLTSKIHLPKEKIINLIQGQAKELMDTDNMYIALFDETTDIVSFGLAYVNGKPINTLKEKGWQPRSGGHGKTEEIIRKKKPLFHATKSESEAWYEVSDHKEYIGSAFSSWVGVPMMLGAKVLGVIATYHPERENVYNTDDLETLQMMAYQAAIALENANLFYDVNKRLEAANTKLEIMYSGAERRRNQLELIRSVAKTIAAELDLQVCLERILDETNRLFGAHYATIQFVDEISNELVIQARRGIEGKKLPPSLERIDISSGITGETVSSLKTIRVGDVNKYTKYLKYIEDTQSEMATPLFEHGKVIGVLNVEEPRKDAFNEDDEELFELLAEEVVIAIQNARNIKKQKEVEKLEYLGLLAGGVAHRVGSKSGLIRLHVNNLQDRVPKEQQDILDLVTKIERDNQYLIELSGRLFGPAHAAETPIVNIDVNQLLREAIRKATIPTDINFVFEESIVPEVKGNHWLIEVFVEIITNAIKYMKDSKEKKLIIRTRYSEKLEHVKISFEDTGCGINSDDLPKIFSLFYSGAKDQKVPSVGGYGLWFCNTVLSRFDGIIDVSSQVGKGSIFTIQLPILKIGDY